MVVHKKRHQARRRKQRRVARPPAAHKPRKLAARRPAEAEVTELPGEES